MWKPISRPAHGLADYLYVPLVAAAPWLAGFRDDNAPAVLTCLFAAAGLASALFARAEWGLVRAVPFRTHLTADVALGVAAVAAPWVVGFADNAAARNTFLIMGVAGLAAGLLTRPDEMPERVPDLSLRA